MGGRESGERFRLTRRLKFSAIITQELAQVFESDCLDKNWIAVVIIFTKTSMQCFTVIGFMCAQLRCHLDISPKRDVRAKNERVFFFLA